MTYYAADRTPPGPARLMAFTERTARDGYVKSAEAEAPASCRAVAVSVRSSREKRG
jgi:hypothetical protein